MPEDVTFFSWLQSHLPEVWAAVRKDRWRIVLFTLLVTVAGFIAANRALTTTRSTVQLMVAPMPALDEKDPVEVVPKMDITSIALLCRSDEVLRRTKDALDASGELVSPIPNLRVLSRLLTHKVTVAKETPMEKQYSDILELTAKSKEPKDAALIVNAWAEEIIAAVDRYEEGMEKPTLEIFNLRFDQAKTTLTHAEEKREKWYAENNQALIKARRLALTEQLARDVTNLAETEAELEFERAKVEGYLQAFQYIEPKVTLSWSTPEGALGELLASRLAPFVGDDVKSGAGAEKDGSTREAGAGTETAPGATKEAKPSLKSIIEGSQEDRPTEGARVLAHETLNEAFWQAYADLLLSQSKAEGLQAKKTRQDKIIEEHMAEEDKLNAEEARLEMEAERIEREYALAKEVHDIFYPRREWIDIASQVDYQTLLMLSKGTEWPQSHLMSVLGALVLGAFGCFAAVCTSLFVRLFLQPALKTGIVTDAVSEKRSDAAPQATLAFLCTAVLVGFSIRCGRLRVCPVPRVASSVTSCLWLRRPRQSDWPRLPSRTLKRGCASSPLQICPLGIVQAEVASITINLPEALILLLFAKESLYLFFRVNALRGRCPGGRWRSSCLPPPLRCGPDGNTATVSWRFSRIFANSPSSWCSSCLSRCASERRGRSNGSSPVL